MAAEHPEAYWRAVALAIEAENQKAKVYVTHDPSLGIAREAILRKVLENETPGPFQIKTGLIRDPTLHPGAGPGISNQCDLLVYDSHADTPLYRMDEFVVVSPHAARFVIETKSYLDQDRFRSILDVWQSVRPFSVPTAGFAYEGVTFETFLNYLAEQIKGDSHNLPECMAVHQGNYLAFRPRFIGLPDTFNYFALDFGKAGADSTGRATAAFLKIYTGWLLEEREHPVNRFDGNLPGWFFEMQLPPEAKKWISPDGKVNDRPLYPFVPSDAGEVKSGG